MGKPFEIFRIDSAGESVWVGEADEIGQATEKAQAALAAEPHYDYCVLDQQTGAIESFQLGE